MELICVVQLACNYSPQLMTLLQANEVRLDWIKLSRWSTFWHEHALCAPIAPMLLHTLPHATMNNLHAVNFDEINKALEASGSPHIALHLSALPEDWGNEDIPEEDIVARMLSGVRTWKKAIAVDLLIENVPYYGFRGTHRCATDPEVIRTICDEADVGLLLDLAHARVAAWHQQENIDDYLNRMPLERAREIHVCGPALDPEHGYLRDRHLEMQEEDYELLARVVERINPLVVSLEYGGTGPKFEWRSDTDTIRRQLHRLSRML